jgi:hypothetical protein
MNQDVNTTSAVTFIQLNVTNTLIVNNSISTNTSIRVGQGGLCYNSTGVYLTGGAC